MMSLDWGTPGAGKTHNLMKYQVLPALASGRSVFTNINGLQEASCIKAICEYTSKSQQEIDHLLTVFPVDGRVYIGDPANGISKSIGDNLYELVRLGDDKIQGDLIVIDEASDPECFDSEKRKVNDKMWIFFKKHRHYNVDICLMAHHPRDLIPKIARLCAEYTYYRKLIGFNAKKFRYEKWLAGYSSSSHGTKVKQGIESYDDKIFECYKSTVAGDGSKDGTMDKRFSVWKSKAPYAIVGAFFILAVGGYLFQKSFLSQGGLIGESDSINQTNIKDIPVNNLATSEQNLIKEPVPKSPKKADYFENLFESSKIVYEGYIIRGRHIDGFVSFWNGEKLKLRMTFNELRNYGTELTLPSFASNIMLLKYKNIKYYALAEAPRGFKQAGVVENIKQGTSQAFGE